MGCLCSKSKNQVKENALPSINKTTSDKHGSSQVISVLHQSISLKNSKNALASLAELFVTNQYEATSLLICPPSDELLRRSWIRKRGHLVRTWKKRYCVMEKSDLKYYVQPTEDPPYGKKYKGRVALTGAVCIDKESEDGKTIEVEIYGNIGEKDLFFEVDNDEDGQTFIRILHWAIRRNTLTLLIRNLKTNPAQSGGSKKERAEANEKQSCVQWREQQTFLFDFGIQKLFAPQIYYFLLTEPTGQITIKPVVMKLWTIFGETYIPTSDTADPSQIGIGWHTIAKEDLENNRNPNSLPFFEDQVRFMAFEDIVDLTFQYVDDNAREWLEKNIIHLHHHSKYLTGHAAKRMNNRSESHLFMIVNIVSKYDYKLQLLACCIHDYNECLIAIQHILFFFAMKSKLDAANASAKDSVDGAKERVKRGSSSTLSIHQCAAAVASNLVLD